ncbi:manganese efflux pump MntP [Paludifilum halophilum]|nr:manganese efflux pump [Paludifilum halophilum]
MESLIPLFLIALSANVDNIGVGLVYGLKNRRIPYTALWAVTAIGGISSGLAVEGSEWMRQWLPAFLEKGIAGGILILIGLHSWTFSGIKTAYYNALMEKEWWFLAVGLSLNNLGMGMSGGFLGYSSLVFGLLIGLASGCTLYLGCHFGQHFNTTWQKWIHPVGACLLIAMGVYQFWGG